MALFGLMKDKCFYCEASIEKGKEHTADVKVPGYTGTSSKKFCSEEHVASYKEGIKNRPRGSGGSCCG